MQINYPVGRPHGRDSGASETHGKGYSHGGGNICLCGCGDSSMTTYYFFKGLVMQVSYPVGDGLGYCNGDGFGYNSGYRNGCGYGNTYGDGYGDGYGYGYGDGFGDGYGDSNGNGYDPVSMAARRH